MSSAFQNRLVGTIIVVALAVIFLPDLLDGEKGTAQTSFVSVPEAPAQEPLVSPQTFPSDEVAQAASRPLEVVDEPVVDEAASTPANTDVQTSEPANETPEQAAPTLAEQTTIERSSEAEVANAGWVIQLGSFRHQKNVRELLDKLENSGYRAFSRPVNTSAGRLTKVFVGPDLERDSLQDALPHLKELTGLSGKITQFKV